MLYTSVGLQHCFQPSLLLNHAYTFLGCCPPLSANLTFAIFTQTLFIYAKETFQENTSYPPSIYWHNLHPLHPQSLWGTALHRKFILQDMTNDVGAPPTNSLLYAFFISITIRASRNMDTPAFKLMVD